jgi:MFS family permease
VAALDERIVRLNAGAEELGERLRTALLDADNGARERLRAAAETWNALRSRYRFGDATAPADTTGEGLNRIRAPFFAFILAEELTRSFLPSYVSQLLVPVPGISPQVVIGLPIVLFMLIVAIGQPYLGVWSERIGRRRAMLIGATIAMAGFVATALAVNLYDLLLWRSLCALGYGMVFVAAQGYVLDHTGPATRAQGFALFIGAIMVATVCGPSIGGILADNIGLRWTFAVSAALAGLSLLAIRRLPVEPARSAASRPSRPPRLKEIVALTFNRRFITLTGLAAMPAKIMLTGVCFYLVPLYIVSIGDTRAMAGRLLMVYAVVMVLLVPLAAGLSTATDRRERLVALGLCVSGMGGFVFQAVGSFHAVLFAVLMLGVGQALSIAAQSALVGDHCREEIRRYGDDAVYGVYRLLERLGNAIGPLLASVLVVSQGYEGAFIGISALVLVCGLMFAFLTRIAPPAPPT